MLITMGCSPLAAKASASRRQSVAWFTDSLTWFESVISDCLGALSIGVIVNMETGKFQAVKELVVVIQKGVAIRQRLSIFLQGHIKLM